MRTEPTEARDLEADLAESYPVLVVDDEPLILQMLKRVLGGQGWTILAAASAEEALRLIEEQELAAVVCDYRMPEMDGVELLSIVRERFPHAERILLTAHTDTEALERGINDGGLNRIMRKPCPPELLLSAVSQAVHNSRIRREHALLLERLRNRSDELAYLNRLLRDRVEQSDRDLTTFRRRWDAALDAISDPLVIVSPALRIEGANATAAGVAGRTAEQMEGCRCHEALWGSKTPCESCPVSGGSGRMQHARGDRERTFEVTAYALPGETPAYLCTYRDVTHRLAFEREAAHVEKMAAVGRLAGGIAHELNNPLHAILTFCQLANKPDVPPEKLVRYRQVIQESALRCRDIVEVLRSFARREGTGGAKQVLDVNQVLDRALVLFNAMVSDRRIERTPADGEALCLGNANRLQQVLVNLVQNAVDATPPGGRVLLDLRIEGRDLIVAVDDEGPGVPDEHRKHIFEPFFTTKPEGVGTGLGLAISHQIMQEHGGAIVVSRAPAGGARFEVRLPHLTPTRQAIMSAGDLAGA